MSVASDKLEGGGGGQVPQNISLGKKVQSVSV